ncbi:MAG: sulfatase-like hydrolase/transferase [Candidatus Delongbacteria bacterium]|nr:sulfatase-like hydrolase/transferase [Candidatus Delongbacteria bacterium]
MKAVIKNILPSLLIVWLIFVIELLISDLDFGVYSEAYWSNQLKIFIAYTILGALVGGISAGIITTKKKKYVSYLENNLNKQIISVLKNVAYSLLMFFILVSREVINQPAFYKSTLLNENFWFSSLFRFLVNNFSPLYFTIFLTVILGMFIHNIYRKLSVHDGISRFAGYILSIGGILLIMFNYGWANADEYVHKNVLFIGIKNLKNGQLSRTSLKDLNGFNEIISTSYNFENCFALSNHPQAAVISLLSSHHPEKYGFLDGIAPYGLEDNTILSYLNKNYDFNTSFISDKEFAFTDHKSLNNLLFHKPDNEEIIRAMTVNEHSMLPVTINNKLFINFFNEIFYLSGYQDRTYIENKFISRIKKKGKPFGSVYILSDNNKNLPYPYYKMIQNESFEKAYLTYLDDELQNIISILKSTKKYDNTIIVLFGIPDSKKGLKNLSYKIPLFISNPEFKNESIVHNNYTVNDIVPSILDLMKNPKSSKFEGVSLFEPEFKIQDIILTDWQNSDQNLNSPLIPRALIRGDYKLNIKPLSSSINYELYDIKLDPFEKTELSFSKKRILNRMIQIYEDKLEDEFGCKVINGYAFR